MGDNIGDIQESGQRVEIRLPVRHNPILQKVIERVNADEELYALWTVMNVNAVTRLGMTDHELLMHAGYDGTPLACHMMLSTGPERIGLASPGRKRPPRSGCPPTRRGA